MDLPDWYDRLRQEQDLQEHEWPEFEWLSLEEFCGRFDLSRDKALYEIKRVKLWGCGKSLVPVYSNGNHTIDGTFLVPAPEADRYAAILEAEKQQEEPAQNHPVLYLSKRNPAYSTELEAAVSCWLALFADAVPGAVAAHTKKHAEKWLSENRPKLSKAQRARIATILTPDRRKDGGAPPTPE